MIAAGIGYAWGANVVRWGRYFFNYANLVIQVRIGDGLLIRISKRESNGRTNVLSARLASKVNNCEAVKYFCNTLKIVPDLKIVFVDDSFVPSQIIKK